MSDKQRFRGLVAMRPGMNRRDAAVVYVTAATARDAYRMLREMHSKPTDLSPNPQPVVWGVVEVLS